MEELTATTGTAEQTGVEIIMNPEIASTAVAQCPEEEDAITCTDSCLILLAQEENNEVFCNKITVFTLQSSCLIDIAIVTENPDLCKDIESSKFCYLTLAGILEDPTICENIESEFVAETCKKNVQETIEENFNEEGTK